MEGKTLFQQRLQMFQKKGTNTNVTTLTKPSLRENKINIPHLETEPNKKEKKNVLEGEIKSNVPNASKQIKNDKKKEEVTYKKKKENEKIENREGENRIMRTKTATIYQKQPSIKRANIIVDKNDSDNKDKDNSDCANFSSNILSSHYSLLILDIEEDLDSFNE